MTSPSKSHLGLIFFTVFLYLVGFGVLIPILPVLSREYGASATQVGLLMSVYSLMQFVFAPFWGRLSDRKGRRPILVYCLLGEAASYLLFAFTNELWGLFVARAIAGFFGASLSTASAAISDVTEKSERSKGMAIIGAAFGLGFVIGPAIGGFMTLWGEKIFSSQLLAMKFAIFSIAGLCFLTFLFAYFKLKETNPAVLIQDGLKPPPSDFSDDQKRLKLGRLQRLMQFLAMPTIGTLIQSFFMNSLAMSTMEATLILFAADRFGWTIKEVSFGFAFIGLMSAFNQGYLIRKLLPIWGERALLRLGLSLLMMSYFTISMSHQVWMLALAMVFLSFGQSFSNPSLLGSISLLSPAEKQGEALGTTQGTASLGRILGPAIGGVFYQNLGMASPFLLSAAISILSLFLVSRIIEKIPNHGKKI